MFTIKLNRIILSLVESNISDELKVTGIRKELTFENKRGSGAEIIYTG